MKSDQNQSETDGMMTEIESSLGNQSNNTGPVQLTTTCTTMLVVASCHDFVLKP